MSLFTPKRLLVKPQSKHSKITQEIFSRARTFNPDIAIEYLDTADFIYPVDTPREKFLYMKDSAIISERSEDFIRTFDSPGNIVESLTTVLNLSWMCASNCEFCYLQTNQTPEHYFYTNLERAEHEIAASPAAHAAILTLWTHLSDYFGGRLYKLPDRFKETADWIRELFVGAHTTRDSEAIDRYFLEQDKIVDLLNDGNSSYQVDPKAFTRDRQTIKDWYTENLKYPLTLTASEFNDFLAVDHLTDNSSFLMQMLEKYPRFQFTIRSRSSYVDGFLRYDGHDRARFNITLNTEFAINEFEHGTATLDERLHAARRIQDAKGYALSLVLEPMLTYENYLDEYKALIRRAVTELNPARISKIILGSARYAIQLKAMVRMHFPDTKLFDPVHKLVPPTKPDTKNRYSPEVRKTLYSTLIAEIQSMSSIPVALGSETPDMWQTLKMSTDSELGDRVFESRKEAGMTPPLAATPSAGKEEAPHLPDPKKGGSDNDIRTETEEEESTGEGVDDLERDTTSYWFSIAPQDLSLINSILGEIDALVPVERFEAVYRKLRSMVTVREWRDEKTAEFLGQDVKDEWSIHESQSLNALLTRGVYFEPAKVVGRISRVSEYTPHEVEDSTTKSFVILEISDIEEGTITTLDIQADCINVDLARLQDDRTRCTFLGAIVPLYPKKGPGQARFYLHDIVPEVSPIDLVPWTPAYEDETGFGVIIDGKRYSVPKDHPTSILRTHGQTNGVIEFIKDVLALGLGIQALDKAPELSRALEFVILQAFSQGKGDTLEKLHGLVIGPPNVGKAYLTRAALILNTVGQEISSSGRKVTVAGLMGTVKPKSKKNVSEPGILPSNHDGVVCIQEFHDVRAETRKAVCGLFVRMMEEGRVIESTSADTIHPAETALLLDMNRYSQINPTGHFNSFTDIDIPVNMLARFDYIVEIPRDAARAKETAGAMIENFGVMGAKKSRGVVPWEMRLKYLAAFLRTEYKVIENPDDVKEHIRSKVNAMLAEVPGPLQNLVDDMGLRIMRSAFKLTKAVTTANASRKSTMEYADYALRFVQDKVNFIKSFRLEDVSEDKPSITDVEKRREILESTFRGQRFDIEQVIQLLTERMEGDPLDKRTIQRDLKALGAWPLTKPKGTWSLKRK